MTEQLGGDGSGRGLPSVQTVRPEDTLAAVGARMREHGIGSLVVVDAQERIVGILSERDVVTKVLGGTRSPTELRVRDVMTTEVISCSRTTTMREAQEVMTRHHIRHLPIVEAGRPVGMISAREVLAHQRAQDAAMRSAAEQVARLYGSLRILDLDELMELTAREVPGVFGAERGVVCLPEENRRGETVLRVYRANCPCPEQELRTRDDTREAQETLRPVEGPTPLACRARGAGDTEVILPLGTPQESPIEDNPLEQLLGYLCMCGFAPQTQVEKELLEYKISLLRETLGANFVKARLFREYQRARRAAVTDPLTGLGTRRYLEDKLSDELDRARRYGTQFALAFLDLDHFKLINDRLGHDMGDQVLIRAAECMRQEKRSTDAVARYGGDEFVLLMPQTNLDGANRLLQRLRARIEALPAEDGLATTVSAGVVEQDPAVDLSGAELLRRADLALYEAKRTGRNRITCWNHVPDSLRHDREIEREKIEALRDRVASLMVQSREMFMESICGLVRALDARDPYTKSHSENVMRLSVGIAQQLGLDGDELGVIRRGAMIHDVGKIGIPDAVLCKPGQLDEEERRVMEQHPLIGVSILDQMRFLDRELPIVRQHHERWDGQGYPDGAAGQAIARHARIVAVADALEAITSTRNYHEARPLGEALAVLRAGAGSQFDPEPVEAVHHWAEEIAARVGAEKVLQIDDLLEAQKDCTMAA